MDRAMLEDHLALAERHVAQGEDHIRRQREIVDQLTRNGHIEYVQNARELLAQFEELQALHVGDRDRLKGELSAGS